MKNLIITIMLLLLTTGVSLASDIDCNICHSEKPLQYNAVHTALTYEGLTELTNKNDGIEITRWLKNVGLNGGYPYCAAFMYSMYMESQQFLSIKTTLPLKSARVSTIYYHAKKNPFKYKVFTPNQVFLEIETLEVGDIPIWTRSADDIENFNGHTGLIIEQISNEKFKSIEANTRSDSKGDQGEGGGIFIKTRSVRDLSFKLKGFIRLRENK